MGTLEEYYNKFNEDKRLNSRHGQVEFLTSMRYIHKYLKEISDRTGREKSRIRILDIGAGTGRYSIALAEEGYDVSAVELVKHNLGRLKAKSSLVKAYQGNALRLKRFEAEAFDMVLLFGPLYHLHGEAEKRHTYGSHFKYNERYPRYYARFKPDRIKEVGPEGRQEQDAEPSIFH